MELGWEGWRVFSRISISYCIDGFKQEVLYRYYYFSVKKTTKLLFLVIHNVERDPELEEEE